MSLFAGLNILTYIHLSMFLFLFIVIIYNFFYLLTLIYLITYMDKLVDFYLNFFQLQKHVKKIHVYNFFYLKIK